jgi:hypothetical protein
VSQFSPIPYDFIHLLSKYSLSILISNALSPRYALNEYGDEILQFENAA